jgi:chemotaxis protein CheD
VAGPLPPIVAGDCVVTSDLAASYQVILGSCVAACIWEPRVKVGGVNHFLLPGAGESSDAAHLKVTGGFLMDRLIRSLLSHGAALHHLRARLFGGAHVLDGQLNIGRRNAEFAAGALTKRGITLVSSDLGGRKARWLQVWPAEGRVVMRQIDEQAS